MGQSLQNNSPRAATQVSNYEINAEFSYKSGMTVIHVEELAQIGIPTVIERVRSVVGPKPTYLTFDIDSLDPAFAPGTGTPEVGGLTTREALELLRGLAGLDIVGGDVVEVAPQYDTTSNTAHAACQILFEILCLSTRESRVPEEFRLRRLGGRPPFYWCPVVR